jgi:hypothetical protein
MKKAKQSSEVLKVGDSVNWRGNWGSHPVVKSISVGSNEDPVESVKWEEVNTRDVIVDLDNKHWAYGNQLSRL